MKTLEKSQVKPEKKELVFVNKNWHKSLYYRPVAPVFEGRYGIYSMLNGFNYSEKKLLEMGYSLESLTKSEIKKIKDAFEAEKIKAELEIYNEKMFDRFQQVEICLKSEPIEISHKKGQLCPTANLSGKGMIEAYHGCGKGTAYVNEGKLIAFHYGYDQPINAPLQSSTAVRVELSCTQVCFF